MSMQFADRIQSSDSLILTVKEFEEILQYQRAVFLGAEPGTRVQHWLYYQRAQRQHYVIVYTHTQKKILRIAPYSPAEHASIFYDRSRISLALQRAVKFSYRSSDPERRHQIAIGYEGKVFFILYFRNRERKLRAIKTSIKMERMPTKVELENDQNIKEALVKIAQQHCKVGEDFDDLFFHIGNRDLPEKINISLL